VRIGLFHNRYRYRGGEDTAVEMEAELLAKAGHEVHVLRVDNRAEIGESALGALRTGLRARWNPATPKRVEDFLAEHPVDVAHVHNYFPVLSPSLHAALRACDVPVMQSLHNFRLLCANGYFLRDGRPCEDCVSRGPWNAVRHGCYRGSRLQTAVWSEMTAHHRRRMTWHACVDLFVTPSRFARSRLLQTGIPPERLRVLPLPVLDPGPPSPIGEGALFVGRLSREKGVDLLIDAWRRLEGYPLDIVGVGPEQERLRERAAGVPGVRFVGELSRDRVLAAMADAAFVVAPSCWYEIFGLTVLEAMACGRAVVVSDPTALSELVDPEHSGLLVERGDVESLAQACRALAFDAARTKEMGRRARHRYLREFGLDQCLARHEDAFLSIMR
jgi:glycosyltransferase involved in cell wall biosynthesis